MPGGSDTANFTGSSTNVQPSINEAHSISSLYLDGSVASWTINGPGPLTLSNGTVTLNWGAYAYINPAIVICSNTLFNIGVWSGNSVAGLWLYGTLTGTGPLNVIAQVSPQYAYLHYCNNTAPNFTGGTVLTNSYATVEWVMTNSAGNYVFGKDAAGVNPGTITLNNGGGFSFSPNTTAGTLQEMTFSNPFVVNAGGGALYGIEGTNTHVTFTGNLTLGGPLEVNDGLPNSGRGSNSSTPPLSIGNPMTLKRYARAVMYETQYNSRSVNITGNLMDEFPAAPTPLVLLPYTSNGGSITIANPSAGGNTYAGGTVVDYCGNMRHQGFHLSRVVVSNTATLGTGSLTVQPGGRILLMSTQNVAAGATISVNGNAMAAGVVSVTYNSVPANLTNSNSSTVLGLDTTNNFTAISDQSAVGNGYMFLGTTLANATLAPASGALLPGKGNVYRLGGGGVYNTANYCGTLNYYGVLTDNGGSTALQVGQNAWQGQGNLNLTNANTFTGPIDVWCPSLWYNNNGWPSAYGYLAGNALASNNAATGGPFGNTNGIVNLHNAGIQIGETSPPGALCKAVTKGHLTFEGNSYIKVDANDAVAPFVLGLDASSRTNGGMLQVSGAHSTRFQSNERIIVAGGANPPGFANGMAAPYILAGTDFATYDTTVSNGYVRGFGVFTNYVALPMGGGTGTEVVRTNATTVTGDCNIYALKTTGNLSSDGVANRTITIGSGGVILGGHVGANGATYQVNLNFGSAEGILFNSAGGYTVYGKISGTKGLTIAGYPNSGEVTLLNTNNDFTGTVTLNQLGLYAAFDSASGIGSLGPASNGFFFNGGMLFRNSGDRLLATRTLTLGPLGGRIYANDATTIIYGQITGPGDLTAVRATVILANDTTQGQSANNYTGGTRVLYSGTLIASNNVSLGSGDLELEQGSIATLWGNANLASSAKAYVPFNGTLNLAAPAPVFGNITGGGALFSATARHRRTTRRSRSAGMTPPRPSTASLAKSVPPPAKARAA